MEIYFVPCRDYHRNPDNTCDVVGLGTSDFTSPDMPRAFDLWVVLRAVYTTLDGGYWRFGVKISTDDGVIERLIREDSIGWPS